MPQQLKVNDFSRTADKGRANQWFADANSEFMTLRKLIHKLTTDKIDDAPDTLTVTHVNVFQHFADPSEMQVLAADTPIQPLGENLPVFTDFNLTMTARPTISAPDRSGQILFLHNRGTATVTLQDEANMPDSTLRMGGTNLDIGANEAAVFMEVAGAWVLHGYGVSDPRFDSLRARRVIVGADDVPVGSTVIFYVNGTSRFESDIYANGFIYQFNPSKAVDMQNMILRGTATVFDREGFRNAISAAVQNHVHDFTASGSVPYSYVIPGAFEGLDDDGNPLFGAPSTVNVNIPFSVTGTTGLERLP